MEEQPPTRRTNHHRWFRFSLRTMFVLVTLLCIYLGWAMNWKRERQQFLNSPRVGDNPNHTIGWITVQLSASRSDRTLPVGLRVVGERHISFLTIYERSPDLVEEGRRLFPEATILELAPIYFHTEDTFEPTDSSE